MSFHTFNFITTDNSSPLAIWWLIPKGSYAFLRVFPALKLNIPQLIQEHTSEELKYAGCTNQWEHLVMIVFAFM